ncbi:MAG: type VI secretion system ATPase TssH, partial [Acidimicrobiia bacterium]|nr:type VI secretion system ATPase TssH [Acidimicrobiia bacterium]
MDINTFTQKAQQAVLASRQGASDRNHQQVTPAHLADALFGQPDTIILPLLAKLEVDLTDITGPLRRQLEAIPQVYGADVEVGFSADTVAILEAAEGEKSQMKDTYTSVEHILLALAAADGEVGDLLRATGLTKDAILGALAMVRGAQRVTSQTPEDTLAPLEQFGRDLVEAARDGK